MPRVAGVTFSPGRGKPEQNKWDETEMLGPVLALCIPAGGLLGGLCFWRVSRRYRERAPCPGMSRAVTVLSEKIRESGFSPDVVVSVGEDGSTIGELLVRRLGLISLTSLGAQPEWLVEEAAGKKRYIPRNLDLDRLRVLLVARAVDTGETLRSALEYVSAKGPRAVRTASIFQVETAGFVPDYHIYQIKSPEEIPLWR